MLDLVVIGAGLSGLLAAHTAAAAGRRVRVVSQGLGSLHWTAGTVDLLGYLPALQNSTQRHRDAKTPGKSSATLRPGALALSSGAVSQPLAALPHLLAARPGHPYGLLAPAQIEAALAQFSRLAADQGLPYGGAVTGAVNLMLPSPAGALRPAWLAPQAQLAGDLGPGNPERDRPLLVVGFDGLRDFYPWLIAANLARQGVPARAAALPLATLTDRRDSSPVQLARSLDRPQIRQKLAAALRRLASPGERLGLPAILGLDRHMETVADLESRVGLPLFEIPTLPPSLPGMRLHAALAAALRAQGVSLETGMAVAAAGCVAGDNGAPGRVEWVASESSARPYRHSAQNYLLASGGILGGGFNSDASGRVWETIFDLPLTAPQARAGWFQSDFLASAGEADSISHPVFSGGVAVNEAFQPVDKDGRVLYANLRAAGQALAGADPIRERSLEGIAISSGIAAGQAAAA